MFDVAGGGTGTTGAGDTDAPSARARSCEARLAEALDGRFHVEPDELGDGELAEAMVDLRRQQARLAAVVAETTAAFDARQVHAEDGARAATDWIAVRARLPRPPAAREVRGRVPHLTGHLE
jgi:hypothetical protein